METRQVVVIAGPTGSGESAITNEIIRRYPARVTRLVTATTRHPRSGERYGVDYYFLTTEEFFEKQRTGEIVEATHVPNRDTYYGSYGPDLAKKLTAGCIVIANPDLVGAQFYKKHYNATTLFITPGDMSELSRRLRKRNPEMTEEELAKRIENAKAEMETERPFYDHVVVNADGHLREAVDEVVSILKRAGYDLTDG